MPASLCDQKTARVSQSIFNSPFPFHIVPMFPIPILLPPSCVSATRPDESSLIASRRYSQTRWWTAENIRIEDRGDALVVAAGYDDRQAAERLAKLPVSADNRGLALVYAIANRNTQLAILLIQHGPIERKRFEEAKIHAQSNRDQNWLAILDALISNPMLK